MITALQHFMKLSKQFVFLLFVFLLAGCQKEDVVADSDAGYCSFRLVLPREVLASATVETKSQKLDTYIIKYLLADEKGSIVEQRFTHYDKEEQRITIEPVRPGRYELFVLAYSPPLEQEGFVVASGLTHKSEAWVRFTKGSIGLMKNRSILFGKSSFEIQGESQLNRDIMLRHVFASLSFNLQGHNEYVESSLNRISVSSQGRFVSSSLSAAGDLLGKIPLQVVDATVFSGVPVYSLPSVDKEPVPFTIRAETSNHEGVNYVSVLSGVAELTSTVHNSIKVSLANHPDSRAGMLFVRSSSYQSAISPRILQDDESSSVYYNSSQRSFRINQPLQLQLTSDDRLHTRFYSPVPLSNVKVWARHPDLSEEILVAFFDTIPAFSDAKYTMRPKSRQVFSTKRGENIALSDNQVLRFRESTLSIESDDPFWSKIRSIKSRWLIRFSSYGGNPNAENGAPNGNWMGIRPVHIRESIALWLNVAYMITLPDFEEKLMKYQGRLYGNGGEGKWIDVKSIIPSITNHPGLNVGLIYTGKGVLGLGGGQTWGVGQSVFLNHYDSTGACETIFHELGHCIGYSHGSNMTYGPWAGELTNHFYVNNIHRFPVNSRKYLNSTKNVNVYR